VAVLFSGGLDSAVLVVESARRFRRVHPVFVRAGLSWERGEIAAARRFLRALGPRLAADGARRRGRVLPLTALSAPARDLYGRDHWSLGRTRIPGASEPDESVYLPGRNLLLLSTAAVWCARRGISEIAIATLGGNPFPDATPAFFRAFSRAATLGLRSEIRVCAPFRGRSKAEVVRLGRELPLASTLSCLRPMRGRACRRCQKCAERIRALRAAGADPRA
jgi:7-cyano-7-deazaguanine synthase